MKLTDYTFPAGMPLSREAFKHQQDGYVEALGATLSALCDPTDGFIVSGCVFPAVTGTVTEGWVYLNREFFWFPGGSLTIPIPANTCFVIDDLAAAAPLATAVYSDSVTRSPFRNRQVRIAVATSGIRLPLATARRFTDIIGLPGPWNEVGAPGQPPFINGVNVGSPPLSFRRAGHGYAQIFGIISLSPASAGGAVPIFTLPVEFRPDPGMDVVEFIGQSISPLSSALSSVSIQGSTGTVSVTSTTGGGIGRSVYFNLFYRHR